jgi:molybdenum cofactor cytidylyltransferase
MSSPRGAAPEHDRLGIGGVVLAAGRSRRMGPRDKLLLEVDGKPMIRSAVEAATGSGLAPVVVVVRGRSADVRRAVEGASVRFVENLRSEAGLSGSLRLGIETVGDVRGAVVLLGDMPWIGQRHVRALIDAFDPGRGRGICVPVAGGRRGNPVLWASRFFEEMSLLEGDVGAKRLMELHPEWVYEVPLDDAVLRDVDTPGAWGSAAREESACPP